MALGLGSLFGSAGLSFLPGLLSALGLFGDPQAALRKKVGQLTSAKNVGAETQQFLQQLLASPAFSQAQGNIAAGANATQGKLESSLGARGIGTSGSGAILSSLIPSLVGQQQSQLRTGAFQSAQQQAQQRIQAQLAALTGQAPAGQTSQLFAGGLDALGPLLKQFLSSRVPGISGPSEAYRDPGFAPLPGPRR